MITRMYSIKGMNCDGCVAHVKTALKQSPKVIEAIVQLDTPQAIVSLREEVSIPELQRSISEAGSYIISEMKENNPIPAATARTGLEKVSGLFHHKKDCCK